MTKRAGAKAAAAAKKAKPAAARKTAAKKAAAKTPAKKVQPPKASATAKAAAKKTARAKAAGAVATRAKKSTAKAPIKAAAPKSASLKKTRAAVPAKRGRKPTVAKAPTNAPQPYLAAELGQPTDHDGEPIGAGSPRAQADRELQEYALQLWRQMQSGSVTKRYMRSIERAGLTVDDIWVSGVRDTWPTSSTPDEMRRYRQKALFRANLLEAILSETVGDLRRLEGIEPTPPADASESA